MFSTLMFIGHLLGCCAASLLHCTISHVSGVVKRRRSLKQGLLRVFFGSANYLKYLGIIPLQKNAGRAWGGRAAGGRGTGWDLRRPGPGGRPLCGPEAREAGSAGGARQGV